MGKLLACCLAGCLIAQASDLQIEWETPHEAVSGGFPRVHQLNNGMLMAVYYSGSIGYTRASADGGATWTGFNGARTVLNPAAEVLSDGTSVGITVANSDFTQFPKNHATYPNRILYTANLRCTSAGVGKVPYRIVSCYSDDYGYTWKGLVTNFTAAVATAGLGCFEPHPYINAAGNAEIYFADKSYSPAVADNQRIARVTSTDGGVTWSAAETVCESVNATDSNKCGWDGMPIMWRWNGHEYLAIETRHAHPLLRPEILVDGTTYCQPFADETLQKVTPGSDDRKFKNSAAGAPSICETENYIVLANHTTTTDGDVTKMRPHVNAVPKAEIGADGLIVGKMRGDSCPDLFLHGAEGMTHRGARWTCVTPLGGDAILLTTMWCYTDAGGVNRERTYVAKGTIRGGCVQKSNGVAADSLETACYGSSTVDGWTSQQSAAVVDAAPTQPEVGAGLPKQEHTRVMAVQGTATMATTETATRRQYDFAMQVHVPASAGLVATPAGDPLELAVKEDGCLYYATAATTGWTQLTNTVYAEGTWVRVGADLDYGRQTAKIYLDGVLAQKVSLGSATASAATFVAAGETAIDDLVITRGYPQFSGYGTMAGTILLFR